MKKGRLILAIGVVLQTAILTAVFALAMPTQMTEADSVSIVGGAGGPCQVASYPSCASYCSYRYYHSCDDAEVSQTCLVSGTHGCGDDCDSIFANAATTTPDKCCTK